MGLSVSQGLSDFTGLSRNSGLSYGNGLSDNGQGGGSVNPLRFVTPQNLAFNGGASFAGRRGYVFRRRIIIANACTELKLLSYNWVLGSSTETDIATSYTYEGISIEAVTGGTVVPVLWSGSQTTTFTSGQDLTLSDSILPSQFSLSTFAAGTEYWIKGSITVPTNGDTIPQGGVFRVDVANQQAAWYDTATTTISSVNAGGVFTFTGGTGASQSAMHCPLVVGRPVVDSASYFSVGDSIAVGLRDISADQGLYGRGVVHRSLHATDFSSPLPSCQIALSGVGTAPFINASLRKWEGLIPYATRGIEGLGTNNIGSQTLATIQTNENTVWSRMFGGGISKLLRIGLYPRTSSTDSWATTANQTPVANWTAGGDAELFNTYCAGQVGTGVTAFCPIVTPRDGTVVQDWAVNGTANYMTDDGTHPYSTTGGVGFGNQFAAIDIRAAVLAMG